MSEDNESVEIMEFRDLKKQYQVLKDEIDAAVLKVMSDAHFISGSQVSKLEDELAEYVGVKHCITCANGTDALSLSLMAWGIGEGDAVFVPDFTFFSTAECPAAEGAHLVFVDVKPDTYNIDVDKLEQAIQHVVEEGKYCPKVVIAVDLFGLPANYDRLVPLCKKYNLLLLEDGAQGFGGSIRDKKACSFGDISTTSFFPAKPLGCYGDGGAVFTDNDEWAELVRSYAVHGKSGEDKYNNIRLGRNSRLDTLQAAILLVKLKAFQEYELEDINRVAGWYQEKLKDSGLILPTIERDYISSFAQYTVQLPEDINRDKLQLKLRGQGIPTMVYYKRPMHLQGAFIDNDYDAFDGSMTEKLCDIVLSLPIDPYKTMEEVNIISKGII